MRCPFCGFEESKVTDSRAAMDSSAIRRRRECLKCQKRFTSFETVDLTIQVKKRDGTYEDFSQEKIFRGIESASYHSRISHDQIKLVVSHITADVIAKQTREVNSREIGGMVMQHLQGLDIIAYIRYACVYKRFEDIDDLKEAIETATPERDVFSTE